MNQHTHTPTHRGSKGEGTKKAIASDNDSSVDNESQASAHHIHRAGAGIALMQARTKEAERAFRALQNRVLQLEVRTKIPTANKS
jgi:hypothetical protein